MRLTNHQTRAARDAFYARTLDRATDHEYQRQMRELRAENARRAAAAR